MFETTATLMVKAAKQVGHEEGQIATTITCAVFPTRESGEVHFARIGDSDALLLRDGLWSSAFADPDDGDVIETGATSVLPNHPQRVEYTARESNTFSCALIATDGISRVIEAAPDKVGGPFAETLSSPCSELDFQALIGFKRRGAHDDRTAVAVWQSEITD